MLKERIGAAFTCGALFFAALAPRFAVASFRAELLLVPEESRDAVVQSLQREGRAREASVLVAAWSGDAELFEHAAREALSEEWDSNLALLLASSLARRGELAAAESVRGKCAALRPKQLRLGASAGSLDMSGRRPVVFLHGYMGDADTWSDFRTSFKASGYGSDDLLVFQYYKDSDSPSGADAGLTALGCDTDTPIEAIAARVAENVRIWLRRRAGIPEADSSRDSELPAPDYICHSMGGLVFRVLYAETPELAHRCVTLGTPHFGQSISLSAAGYQTKQMKFGSSFLWKLAEDWRWRGKGCPDMIFVAGTAESKDYGYWDGLVYACSASPLNLSDSDFWNRVLYVNRIHSTVLSVLHSGKKALTEISGAQDVMLKIAYGYLNDAFYFKDGARPTKMQTLMDDGASTSSAGAVFTSVGRYGGMFAQVRHPTTNTVESVQPPVRYPSDAHVVGQLNSTSDAYTLSSSDVSWEHGADGEGLTNGLVMVFGKLPATDYVVQLKAPSYQDKYVRTTIYGGGVSVMRFRPGSNAAPVSSFDLVDDTGTPFTVTVSNSWFAANVLAHDAEDLEGCVSAGTNKCANGFTAAETWWLGLDPRDAESSFAVSAIDISDGVALRVRTGTDDVLPEDASSSSATRSTRAALVVQRAEAPGGEWRDVEVNWTQGDGWWRLAAPYAASPSDFFRVVARPR